MAVPALLIGAMALQSAGGIYSAFQAKKQAESEANDLEASLPEIQYRAKLNKEEVDRAAQNLYGEQVVTTAYSGAMVDTGSPLLNYANTFAEATKQKINIDREASLTMQGISKQASSLRKQAKKAMVAGLLGAGGTIASSLYQHKANTGGFNS